MAGRNFVLLRGFGGTLPRKILKIRCLRLEEIGFPTTYFDSFFLIQSQIALATGDLLKNITPFVLNFHCQRYFDDCLKISVLRQS